MINHKKINDQYFNASNGYWSVGEEVFFSKAAALLSAAKNKLKIRYHYNEHVFKDYKWGTEPTQSLEELYLQRARQIRDTYDYIILLYSAGSDSTNMIRTFLDNNIKIDHVMSWGAFDKNHDKFDIANIEITTQGTNTIKEITSKGIKFSYENFLEESTLEQTYTSGDWILEAGSAMAPTAEFLSKNFFVKKEFMKIAEKGKKVCFLWAREKPMIELVRNSYFLVFYDNLLSEQWHSSWNNKAYPIFHENFYQHFSTPNLIAKQCHVLLNYYEKNFNIPDLKKFFTPDSYTPEIISTHNKIINKLLYGKNWNENNFSTGKPLLQFKPHKCFWFFKDSNTKQHKNWSSGIKELLKNIDGPYKENFGKYGTLAGFKQYYFIKNSKKILS